MEKGWSRTRLARAIKKTPQAISLMEKGRIQPTPETMKKIATALGLPMEELVIPDAVTETATAGR